MAVYALAHLRTPVVNEDVIRYIERIQDTFGRFGGRFLVHGGDVEVMEGSWPGTVVVIEFPDAEQARAWYRSPEYQKILPLRTRNIDGDAILVAGVPQNYDAVHTAAALRAHDR